MIVKKDLQTFQETYRILLRERDFIYILPQQALINQISNYTITFPSTEIISDQYTVIPHGSATLVFSLDKTGLYSNLFGPITKPCMVGTIANQYDMLLIIEFQPAGLSAFTGMNQKELANQTIPFEMIHPALNLRLIEALERTNTLEDLIEHLDRHLWEALHTRYPAELQTASKLLITRAGNLSCKELSTHVYYSERHLNRMFETYFGMNTKTFSRMIRINKAIRLLQDPSYSITCISYDTGFYDLSHFIHEFKSICGLTPQEYRKNMSDFYSEIAKF